MILKGPFDPNHSVKSTSTRLQRVFKELRQQILYLKLSQGAKWPSSPRFELTFIVSMLGYILALCFLKMYIYTHTRIFNSAVNLGSPLSKQKHVKACTQGLN